MKYNEFLDKTEFTKQEILAFSRQNLVEDPPGLLPSLPTPPMLMLDRIIKVEHDGRKGRIVAEQDIRLDSWFFESHFRNDPVQPGCLGVDAVWQLLGFYCGVRGAQGTGRALGCKEVEFFGQIRPHNKVVTYDINVRRYTEIQGCAMVVGTGKVFVDGEHIYTINDAKVGLFPDIQYADFPWNSEHSLGGVMER
ncbi:bifunctional 3-hydroxydecanoyl-ACP dehydratase/trans-2-decenoyl-ACP isomerase [bacterium]|nr:bifunctional 3-hydroxydecanoyl-ACP dehydratase/trans-2-decenoyl-ACP isomerase [bacterium]